MFKCFVEFIAISSSVNQKFDDVCEKNVNFAEHDMPLDRRIRGKAGEIGQRVKKAINCLPYIIAFVTEQSSSAQTGRYIGDYLIDSNEQLSTINPSKWRLPSQQ
jgi:hypothetical protein